jgi:hypothetical protein
VFAFSNFTLANLFLLGDNGPVDKVGKTPSAHYSQHQLSRLLFRYFVNKDLEPIEVVNSRHGGSVKYESFPSMLGLVSFTKIPTHCTLLILVNFDTR